MDDVEPTEFAKAARCSLEKAASSLDALLDKVDARYVFAADALGRIIAANSESASKYFRPAPVAVELNAWLLFPFFGRGTDRSPDLIQKCIDALEAYQKAFTFTEVYAGTDRLGADPLMTRVRLHSSNVRGTAYPIQVYRKIADVLGPLEEEFAREFGVGAIRAAEIARAILCQMEDNLVCNGREIDEIIEQAVRLRLEGSNCREQLEQLGEKLQKSVEAVGDQWIPTFQQVATRLGGLDIGEWEAVASCVGLTPASRESLEDPVDVQDRPIYFLNSDSAFAAQGTAVLDAIFQFFDLAARKRPGLSNRYGDYVSTWMEGEVTELLKRVFPPECVYANACYPNPERAGHEAETDCIVKWGPILVVVEAKGKKVDPEGFRRTNRKLRNTISSNIQEAFLQASRVIRALERSPSVTFREKATGRTLRVLHAELRRVMPISVTLQHLLGVPTQLAVTQGLGLFKGGAYPWSVSIDDLDVISRFAGSPDVFLHYIERRIAHQSCRIDLNADELDVFGHYLDNRLHPSIYEERAELFEHDGPAAITINGGEERFDPFYSAEWYGHNPPEKIPKLDIPQEVEEVLEELRDRTDDGARFIAFALLGLSHGMLARVARNISNIRSGGRPIRQIFRSTFTEDGVVVNVLAHASMTEKDFFQNVLIRTRMEHYRAKARATVSIGIDLRELRAFQVAQWLEGDWEQEELLEELIEQDRNSKRTIMVPAGGEKLGRNSTCPCGSGLKFKKCCMGRIQIKSV